MAGINRVWFGNLFRKSWVWVLLLPLALAAGFVLDRFLPLGNQIEKPRAVEMLERFAPALDTAGSAVLNKEAGAGEAALSARVSRSGLPGPGSGIPRKVISVADLEIKVNSVAAAADELARLAAAMDGFVQSSSYATETGEKTASLVLRVPAERFQEFLATAGRLGTVVKKCLRGQDVTEEYVDLEARLRNWQNQERQLNLILARAKTVGEVLAVQEKLGQVREEIERLEGRIKYLEDNVALATVNVYLHEGKKPTENGWLVRELSALGRAFYGSCRALLVAVLVLLPWGLVGWLIYRLGRWVWGKTGRKG